MPDVYVFAKTSGILYMHGIGYRVLGGQPWNAEDPLVKAHPDAFSAEPRSEHVGTSALPAASFDRLEQATHAPGEVRVTRRGA